PDEFTPAKLGLVHVCAALILIGLYRLRQRPLELIAWLLMLAASWTAVSYGFYKNRYGGGVHYFHQFFVFAWIFILHAFSRRNRWGALYQLALVGLIALAAPWHQLIDQQKTLTESRTKARTFLRNVEHVTLGQPIFGEETNLFKRRYRGEVVDMG